MSIQYLNNKRWTDISREERMFCSYLYHEIKDNPKQFIKFLNTSENIIRGEKYTPLHLDNWEVGYEVCLYRDLLYLYGKSIKKYNLSNIDAPNKLLPQKRTFDLCLFSENEIIIVEAKCHEGFHRDQLADIKNDGGNIKKLFEIIGLPSPNVSYVLLTSSKYEISNKTIKEFSNSSYRIVYWNDLASNSFIPLLADRADELYRSKLRSKYI